MSVFKKNIKCSDNANLNVLERNVMTRAEKYGDGLSQSAQSVPNLLGFSVATQQSLMYTLFIRVTHKLLTTAIYTFQTCRGADKSLAFPICSTIKIIFLGWVKEVRTTKP
jgi:hypothetical protein